MADKIVLKQDADYASWVRSLSERYRRGRSKAAVSVNREMLAFYWSLGRDIVAMHAESRWGSGLFKELSRDLQKEIPNAKGFSPANLRYMKRFYELSSGEETAIVPQLAEQLQGVSAGEPVPQLVAQVETDLFSVPWGHIRLIIDRAKGDRDFAEFCIRETIENGWRALCS